MPRKPDHIAPEHRPAGVNLFALPSGGFLVRDPHWRETLTDFGRNDAFRSSDAAAFTTLDEALAWLRVYMQQPAKDATI